MCVFNDLLSGRHLAKIVDEDRFRKYSEQGLELLNDSLDLFLISVGAPPEMLSTWAPDPAQRLVGRGVAARRVRQLILIGTASLIAPVDDGPEPTAPTLEDFLNVIVTILLHATTDDVIEEILANEDRKHALTMLEQYERPK